jgi:hypothetical protein
MRATVTYLAEKFILYATCLYPVEIPHSKAYVVLLTPAVLPATTLHLRSGVGHQTLGTLARGLTLLGDAHGAGAAGVRLARVAGWCASGARRGVGR